MANDTALGQILEIDEKTVKSIDGISTSIDKIATSVENASKKFQEEFGKMNLSATTLNESLGQIHTKLKDMGVDLTKPLTENLNNAATSANNAAASITNAAKAMGEFGIQTQDAASKPNPFANLRYVDLQREFEQAKATLPAYGKEISEVYQKIDTMNRAMASGCVDRERFTADIEAQKAKGQELKNAMNQQISVIKQMNAEISRRKTLYASENAQTRMSIQYYKAESDEVQKLYTRLFDLAKAREDNAKKKQEKIDTAALKEEQRIYSQLEQQYIRLSALKQKSVGADGVVKDAANYQKILDLMQKTEQEMQKMLSVNPQLKQNELAIVAARQREVEVTQRLTREQEKLNQKKLKEFYETPKGALQFANTMVKSYQDRAQAIKYLETAMKNLDRTEAGSDETMRRLTMTHQKLRIEQEKAAHLMGDLKNNMDKVTSTAQKLASTLGIVFSVQAIAGYVKSLIEVRGEFELQNTALRAILQNKDEADRLFAQVTQLAIKSPYSIRQLTSYTKQLAAYRVESDKLYDTTKRLADVSSGLGVDMQRIILAYGQVKAANYLRATEVRQFTEAGINVLGELSKYYTELEGRMVSVADVQERITKRMVEFGDVEEIFRRMTDAGGIFYNMQAKQAETLRGMMMNLRDSMDIMLNDIGMSTEGALKGTVRTLTNLIRNWREVMYVIKPVLGSFIALQAAMKIYGMGAKVAGNHTLWFSGKLTGVNRASLEVAKSLTYSELRLAGYSRTAASSVLLVRSLETALIGLGKAFLAVLPVAAIAGVMLLLRKLTEANREAKRLDKEINKTISESVSEYRKSETELKSLVSRLHDVNTGSYEHQQIIEKLNSQYGDYIGFLVTENTTYEQMSDTLDTVIARLKEKSAYEASGKALQQAYESQTAAMDEARMSMLDAHVYAKGVQQERKLTEREVDIFLNNYEKKVRELGRELTFEEQYNVLSETLDLEISSFNLAVGGWNKISSLAQSILKTKQKELDVQNTINSRYEDQFSTVLQSRVMEEMDANKRVKLAEIDKDNTLSAFERERKIQAVELDYQRERIVNELAFGMISEDAAKKRLKALMQEPQLMKSINEKFSELAKNAGFTEEEYSKLLFTNTKWEKGLTSIEKQIKETWEAQGDIIAQQTRYKEQGLAYNKEELAQAEKQQQLYRIMAEVLGLTLEDEKKAAKTNNDIAKERIDLLKKIRQEYEQNRKVMGEDEASAFTKSQFKDNAIFKQLQKLGVIDATLNVDSAGLITALKRLAAQSGESARREIESMIATLNNEQIVISITANMEGVKNEIEGLFDRLDLTKELEKLGLDKALTEQIFGFKTIDTRELREQLEIIKEEYSKANQGIGTEQLQYFAEVENKITQMEQKELQERLKNYAKYLKMEASAAVQAKLEEAKELAELEATQELTEPQKQIIRTRIQEETQTKVDKARWDQFENTDMYIRMFEDLNYVSTAALDSMETKLNTLRGTLGNLDPQSLKEIENQLRKIEDIKMQRSPFEYLISSLKEINALRSQGLTPEYLQTMMEEANIKAESAQKEIEALEYVIGLQEQNNVAAAQQYLYETGRYDLLSMTTDQLRTQVAEQKKIKSEAENASDEAANNLNTYTKANKSMKVFTGNVSKFCNEVSDLLGDVNGLVEQLTGESSEVLETFSDIVGTIGESIEAVGALSIAFVAMGVALDSSLGIIGLILIALKAIIAIVSSIIKANDEKLAKQIDDSKERVKNLEKAYEKLDKAISDAYDAGKLKAYNDAAEKNLRIQQREMRSQIALYKARKGGEEKYKDEINELRDSIEDIDQILGDNIDRLTEKMGGFGSAANIASAAEEFVDAWYTAFMETGYGLDAMNEKFDEFMDNTIKRQILARAASAALEPIMREVDKAVSKGSEGGAGGLLLTKSELEAIRQTYEQYSEIFNNQARAIMDELGIKPGSQASGGLSGLAEDYGQMTEATATVLASINESIRYFESDSNIVLHAIQNILSVPGENPFYRTMLEQTRYTKEIRDAIYSMTYKVGTDVGMKVRMI